MRYAGLAVALAVVATSCKGANHADASPTGPVTCERDEDCHPGACGPCASGSTITYEDVMQECVVNPCTAAGGPPPVAFCNHHVCTIK